MNKAKILKNAVSPFDQYCDGFSSPGASGNGYVTAITLEVGIAPEKYGHEGSMVLDSIMAFDRAEIESVNIGQINMITVSSFCGLSGLIWGLDIAKHPKLLQTHPFLEKTQLSDTDYKVPVYSAIPLREASYKLFGSVDKKRFPLLPGGHVPCAGKSITIKGPKHIYAAIALGIAKNRDKDACVFMEDIGQIVNDRDEEEIIFSRKHILENIAKSVHQVGKNQKVEYEMIFVDMVHAQVKSGEVGCALVAAPYFSLAKNAMTGSADSMIKSDLYTWEKKSKKKFLGK